jgi:hypothetical protein
MILTSETARIHIKNFEIKPRQGMKKVSCEVGHRVMAPLDPVKCPDHVWTSSSDTHHNHPVSPLSKLSEEQKTLIAHAVAHMKQPTVGAVLKGKVCS